MLSNELKATIQNAYRSILESKGLKPRWGQRLMIAEIAKLLGSIELDAAGKRSSDAPFCVVEAGTGTGKTLAYILATLPIAQALGKKVVISTATVALQEQIVHRDLPDILHHSGLNFRFALAKGRSRYVCLSRLDNLLSSKSQETMALYPDELAYAVSSEHTQLYQSMLDAFSAQRWDGERDSWQDELEQAQWAPITTDRSQCAGRRCSHFSNCVYFRARESIQSVDCIVANHDLVLSDLALGGGAILFDPADTIYIFDEGHHLSSSAVNHFSHFCRLGAAQRWLEQMQKTLGQLGQQLSPLSAVGLHLADAPDLLQQLLDAYRRLDDTVSDWGGEARSGSEEWGRYQRFPGGVVPDELQTGAAELVALYSRLVAMLQNVLAAIEDAMDDEYPVAMKMQMENWLALVGLLAGRAESHYGLWQQYACRDPEGVPNARWLSLREQNDAVERELCVSPILAGMQLESCLWSRCFAAVITSATLTALGSFERLRLHTGLPAESSFSIVPSPFDYANAATLVIPALPCEPSAVEQHTDSIIQLLPELLDLGEGSLVLFASRRQMLNVYQGLTPELRELVLVQGDHTRAEVLRRHKAAIDRGDGSVIFGLASFAEGVDLPGRYCSHVVIAKIPFSVPDQPVEAALSEWVEANGGNPFMDIAVPDAALRLVQASGRLLRTESDRGRITLLDKRVLTKRYGKAILDSLPAFSRQIQPQGQC